MQTIKVKLKENSYRIIIGRGTLGQSGRLIRQLGLSRDACIVTNKYLKNKFGQDLSRAFKKYGIRIKFKLVPDSEKSKSMATSYDLIKRLANCYKQKQILLVAFGGGVIGDLTGFVASVYRRGVSYIQIPTTLLAQVDSGIGGKTAVDLKEAKNLVGTFYQPRLVLVDVGLLKTLSIRQLISGLAEVIKYGVIRDPGLFKYLERKIPALLKKDAACFNFVVARCAKIKAGIVRQDEKEKKGIRTILNFGHTLGHAIEAACLYKKYNHGEAIALGMLVACSISKKTGLLSEGQYKRIEDLIARTGLPTRISGVALPRIIKAHYHDKKFTGKKNKFVLVSGIGKARIVKEIPLGIIREALKERM